jgi:hypothetical protein
VHKVHTFRKTVYQVQVNTLANQNEVYKGRLLSLLKINGPSLVNLSLPFLPSDTNIFEMLDQVNCKLKTFMIISNGVVPKKADYTAISPLSVKPGKIY